MSIEWSKLTAPFPSADVEWRISQAGSGTNGVWAKVLAYITARAIQERLDEVFGVDGWRNEFREGPSGGVICRLYFRGDDGEWTWREDGAENTEIEAIKGGLSGALKRAGAALGIGRYLYHLPEGWAKVSDKGENYGKTKDGASFKWDPPALPAWALPDGSGKPFAPVKADPRTGEVSDEPAPAPAKPAAPAPAPTDEMIPCPKCGSEMFDNRTNKKNPKAPDLKCKSKECAYPIWLSTWRDDLLRDLRAVHELGSIDTEQHAAAEELVKSKVPAKMAKVQKRVHELLAGSLA